MISVISKKFLTNSMNECVIKTVKVSQKGQIAIPSEIQRMIGIKKGDNLILYTMNNKILLKKINEMISEMSDDFKDMERHTENSLGEFWKNEPDGIWEQYLKPKQTKQKKK